MEKHCIAVISDTHGLLRPEVKERLINCEAILHAGDFGKPDILEQLREICPVYGVRGNVDREWAGDLPEELEITLFGFRIYMVHNRKHIKKNLSGIDIIIYGHSHKYEERREGGILYLNPGSCGPKRFQLPITMMLANLCPEVHQVGTERVDCTVQESGNPGEDTGVLPEQDMHRLVKTIMKEVRAGRTVSGIAARNHVKEELAEQICRFYVTHPGVDVDGILDRMERKDL